jgi:uncharacterized protein YggT (Ycf19 family)
MDLINLLLNIAGLLLWLNWRSIHLAIGPERASALSLVSTLRKAEPSARGTRWFPLAGLAALLVIRSFLYWHIGSAVNWTPQLELGAISLHFRSDYLLRMFSFSFLSFAVVLGGFYAWLLLVSFVNRNVSSEEPFQRLVRLHLGPIERWPAFLKLLLPMILATLLWGLASPGLVELGVVPHPLSTWHRWQQAVLLGVTSLLLWKFLVLALCFLYLLNSYIYLGKSSFWSFVQTTGSNLLWPLRRFPVCIGKLDLSPVAGIALVLLLARWGADWLPGMYQRLPF